MKIFLIVFVLQLAANLINCQTSKAISKNAKNYSGNQSIDFNDRKSENDFNLDQFDKSDLAHVEAIEKIFKNFFDNQSIGVNPNDLEIDEISKMLESSTTERKKGFKLLQTDESDSASAKAIVEIITNFFMKQSIEFDFYVQKKSRFNEISSMIGTPVTIKSFHLLKFHHVEKSAILIFNGIESFLMHSMNLQNVKAWAEELYFFVYIENLQQGHLQLLAPNNLLSAINVMYHYMTFLIDLENASFIDLMAFTSFQQPNCNQFHPLTINQFSKTQKKWDTQKFSIKRFQNFNGCKLSILAEEVLNISLYYQIHKIVESSLNFETVQFDIHDCRYSEIIIQKF
jgi:hypothetical protein